jgi:hypothetical protein
MFPILSLTYLAIMLTGPAALVAWVGNASALVSSTALWLLPVAYLFLVPLLAGLLSVYHRRAIVPGKFPTDVGVPRY